MKNRVPFLIAIIFIIQLNFGCGTSQNAVKTAREITVEDEGPRNSSPSDIAEREEIHPIVGNDRDVNGCIRSAGYSWSQVQGRCLQLFNEGIKLLPVENTISNNPETQSGAAFQSFIVFSSDSMRAELFLPNKEPMLFHKTASNNISGTWISGNYKIESQNNLFIVKQNMEIILKQY